MSITDPCRCGRFIGTDRNPENCGATAVGCPSPYGFYNLATTLSAGILRRRKPPPSRPSRPGEVNFQPGFRRRPMGWRASMISPLIQRGEFSCSRSCPIRRAPLGIHRGFVIEPPAATCCDIRVRDAMLHASNFEFIQRGDDWLAAQSAAASPYAISPNSPAGDAAGSRPMTGVRALLGALPTASGRGDRKAIALLGEATAPNATGPRASSARSDLMDHAGWTIDGDGVCAMPSAMPFHLELLARTRAVAGKPSRSSTCSVGKAVTRLGITATVNRGRRAAIHKGSAANSL